MITPYNAAGAAGTLDFSPAGLLLAYLCTPNHGQSVPCPSQIHALHSMFLTEISFIRSSYTGALVTTSGTDCSDIVRTPSSNANAGGSSSADGA